MEKKICRLLPLLLCLVLLLAPAAWADGNTVRYDADVIVGFQDTDFTVDTDYKLALIELRKRFPASLTVYKGGTVLYAPGEDGAASVHHTQPAVTESMAVTWRCLENYDDALDVFHFVPELGDTPLAEGVALPVVTVHVLGELEIPPLVTFDMGESFAFESAEQGPAASAELPAVYNGYELGVLPPIRDQRPYNTCWAFATIAAIEADLIHDGVAGTDIDLSELHLVYFTYHQFFDEKGCNTGDTIELNGGDYLKSGGNNRYTTLAVTNMIGPVAESYVPYSLAYEYKPEASEGRIGDIQVTNAYRYEKNDRAGIKQAILDHGAVNAVYYSENQYYSPTHNSYFFPNSPKTNHSIALVGWDDNFPMENFLITPGGNGAWLVRNSWGTDEYGYGGYFWMSYYDTSLYSMMYAFDVQNWRYDHCYAYDNTPALNWWKTGNGSTIQQKFRVDGNEAITAIGVYCETANVDLRFTVSCGSTSTAADLHIGTPGYYVLPLAAPLETLEKSEVNVQYVITGTGDDVRVNSEGPVSFKGFSGNVGYNFVLSAGRGSGLVINGELKDYDARIKLFTNDCKVITEPDLVLPDDLTRIESEAFRGDACTYVIVSDKVTTIGPNAFADCPNLAFVHIPPATKDISPDAFSGIDGLLVLSKAGSYAETYAREHGYSFMSVEAE